MILFGGASNIDSSLPALPAAVRRAPDRKRGPRDQTQATPGQGCRRCGGLLVLSYTATFERDSDGSPIRLWRCINCGDCTDSDILANRWNVSGLGRPRARIRIEPQRTGRLQGPRAERE